MVSFPDLSFLLYHNFCCFYFLLTVFFQLSSLSGQSDFVQSFCFCLALIRFYTHVSGPRTISEEERKIDYELLSEIYIYIYLLALSLVCVCMCGCVCVWVCVCVCAPRMIRGEGMCERIEGCSLESDWQPGFSTSRYNFFLGYSLTTKKL